MKRPNIARFALPALTLIALGVVACNKHSDPYGENYGDDTSVAVTAFKIKANANVLNNLDTVFFSIDLDNAVIFNADSLPLGTDVTALVPSITYPSSVSAAVISMENGSKRTGEVDYMKNPNDSIDFSGNVSLTLTAQDGETTRTYRLKVNVHRLVSDSLMWDDMEQAALPSRFPSPITQKSVLHDDRAYSLIAENDGSYTLATSAHPSYEAWQKTAISDLPAADIRSFTATSDSFYLLGDNGTLWQSADGLKWSSTGKSWTAVTGAYGDILLGIDSENGVRRHVSYPEKLAPATVSPDFPAGGWSDMGIMQTKWSTSPIALLAGGYDKDGQPVACVWGFDGTSWARISQDGTPALADATLVPYTFFRPSNVSWIHTEYSVWLLLGGRKADGDLNRTVYMSYDNGVNWQAAVDYMQLPEGIPAMTEADALVISEKKQASITDYWTRMPQRIPRTPRYIRYELDGYDITWGVPYIYLFGGYDSDGKLCGSLWRGVLNRLTFTPLI